MILEEEYDPDFEPDEHDLIEYGKFLGLDLETVRTRRPYTS